MNFVDQLNKDIEEKHNSHPFIILAHDDEEDTWRMERLRRLAFRLDGFTAESIAMLHDHEGTLTVHFIFDKPIDPDIFPIIIKAWDEENSIQFTAASQKQIEECMKARVAGTVNPIPTEDPYSGSCACLATPK